MTEKEPNALRWYKRPGNHDWQKCWDAGKHFWICRDLRATVTPYSLCSFPISEVPGCSPFLGAFDTLEDAMDAAQVLRDKELADLAPAWRRSEWLHIDGTWHPFRDKVQYKDAQNWNVTMRTKECSHQC